MTHMSRKERTRQLAIEAEAREKFLTDPQAVDPFVSLGTYMIMASEQLMLFRSGDLAAGKVVQDLMDRIKQEASNVQVDVTMRNFKGA